MSCSSPSNEYVVRVCVRVCWVSRALHVFRFLPTSLCLVPVYPEFRRLLNPAHSSTLSSRTWFLVIKHTFLFVCFAAKKTVSYTFRLLSHPSSSHPVCRHNDNDYDTGSGWWVTGERSKAYLCCTCYFLFGKFSHLYLTKTPMSYLYPCFTFLFSSACYVLLLLMLVWIHCSNVQFVMLLILCLLICARERPRVHVCFPIYY